MFIDARRARTIVRTGNGVAALAVSACLLGALGAGLGTIPALGRALLPGHGAWASAAGARLPQSVTLTVAGLTRPVQVSFSPQGVPSISAQSQDDAYLALGYVQAEYRLAEMDRARRVAEGQLAQLIGAQGIPSDEFELRLGLLRTAQQEWAQLPKSSPAARVLVAYSRGVNDDLAQLRASGQWPAVFSLDGVYPRNWTPVDSLAVQGELTQELDFTTTPLDYALLERSLGAARTMSWFPVLPPNGQNPYDPGPYRKLPLVPIAPGQTGVQPGPAAGDGAPGQMGAGARPAAAVQSAAAMGAGPVTRTPPTVRTAAVAGTSAGAHTAATVRAASGGQRRSRSETRPARSAGISAGLAEAASAILRQTSALPAGQLFSAPASNAWAANGPKVAGGGAMLAGDPHLPQTLPSIWFEAALSAPGLAVSGVSVPGLPAILIGHNSAIAWSLTDTQSQAAMFYTEQTNPALPREYFWDGQWRDMRVLHYTIPVRSAPARQIYVPLTVHGPVLTQAGQTVAVSWMGALGSPDVAAMLGIDRASDFGQFRAALADWRSPAITFAYGDNHGNIGAISAGYYPQVRNGDSWLPLPGTGLDDVAGVIPYAAVPQIYDPRSHVIATANQRPVGPSYPYYLGTTANSFDAGYRADAEYAYLRTHWSMRPSTFAALQDSTGDQLAAAIVPKLLAVLHQSDRAGKHLTQIQQVAQQMLASWNKHMDVGSGAASIWWTFWSDYLSDVFGPWWAAGKVPVTADAAGLAVGPGQSSLDEDLQAWTLIDQGNAAFTSPPAPRVPVAAAAAAHVVRPVVWPGATRAAIMMRAAFVAAVSQLYGLLGEGPGRWQWGKLHTREFPSLTQAAAVGDIASPASSDSLGYGPSPNPASPDSLGYGPRSADGDLWTIDAAEGGMNSEIGPSWRMIATWSRGGQLVAEGIYPGGQSENPASPLYTDLVAGWWSGSYLPMPAAGAAATSTPSAGSIRWELRP
jgi:penicillin G amidase